MREPGPEVGLGGAVHGLAVPLEVVGGAVSDHLVDVRHQSVQLRPGPFFLNLHILDHEAPSGGRACLQSTVTFCFVVIILLLSQIGFFPRRWWIETIPTACSITHRYF